MSDSWIDPRERLIANYGLKLAEQSEAIGNDKPERMYRVYREGIPRRDELQPLETYP